MPQFPRQSVFYSFCRHFCQHSWPGNAHLSFPRNRTRVLEESLVNRNLLDFAEWLDECTLLPVHPFGLYLLCLVPLGSQNSAGLASWAKFCQLWTHKVWTKSTHSFDLSCGVGLAWFGANAIRKHISNRLCSVQPSSERGLLRIVPTF